MMTRQNSSDLLTTLYNRHRHFERNDPDALISYPRVDFKVLSKATPSTVCGVNINFEGAVPPENPVPGSISLTRQLYTFAKNVTPTCESTAPNCDIMSMRTTIAPWADSLRYSLGSHIQ